MEAEGLRNVLTKFRRRGNSVEKSVPGLQPESTFDAVLEMRLTELQRQVGEVKGRVNTLFFFVLGAAIIQVGLRFAG